MLIICRILIIKLLIRCLNIFYSILKILILSVRITYVHTHLYIYIYIHIRFLCKLFIMHVTKYESPRVALRDTASSRGTVARGMGIGISRCFTASSRAKRRESQIQCVPRKATRIATIFASHGVTCVCRNVRINGHIHRADSLGGIIRLLRVES